MSNLEEMKQKFIKTMLDLFPDDPSVQETAREMEKDTLYTIVNTMIPGIAFHPKYDALIPAVQEAVNVLQEGEEIHPYNVDSAIQIVRRSIIVEGNDKETVVAKIVEMIKEIDEERA